MNDKNLSTEAVLPPLTEEQREQYIIVMVRNTEMVLSDEWKMDRGYSINHLGAAEAVRRAQAYIEKFSPLLSNVEFKLEGGEL